MRDALKYEAQVTKTRRQVTVTLRNVTLRNVLAKLEWFRLGGQMSERQWRDVLGVIKVQADSLDEDYLRQWGGPLGVSDLVERALEEGKKAE